MKKKIRDSMREKIGQHPNLHNFATQPLQLLACSVVKKRKLVAYSLKAYKRQVLE
jgi:hypothetical protein